MGQVVDFVPREKQELTASGEAVCLDCRHEWVAVAPAGTKWLLCPSCNLTRGRFKYRFVPPDSMVWECNCGNDLFYASPSGVFCPNCGETQIFP